MVEREREAGNRDQTGPRPRDMAAPGLNYALARHKMIYLDFRGCNSPGQSLPGERACVGLSPLSLPLSSNRLGLEIALF